MKDSFILYTAQKAMIDKLTDEQAGKLIKAIFSYVENNEENPELDFALDLVFTSFKISLDKDKKKYEETCEARARAGSKGGKQKVANQAKGSKSKQNKQKVANQADYEYEYDSSYEEEKKIKKENDFSFIASEIIDFLNTQSGCSYKANTKATQDHIRARLKEGYTVDDFKKVIASKATEWGNNPKMRQYIRPNTLFAGKFESYLQEALQNEKQTSCLEIQGFD